MKSGLGKVLRYFAFGTLALVLAGLLATSYLVLTFDPDDYRDDLINLVEERTGRAFAIDGSLELHLNPPWVGFEIYGVSFDNAPGFGRKPMLSAKRAEAYLRLVPLMLGELHIHSVRLDGLQLRLRRKPNGHANWDSLLADGSLAPGGVGLGIGGRSVGLGLGEIRLTDSIVVFQDELRQRRVQGSDLSLKLSDLTPAGGARIELQGEVAAWPDTRGKDRIDSEVRLSTELNLGASGRKISGRELDLDLSLAGPAFAFKSLGSSVKARSFQWNRADDALRVEAAEIEAEGARLRFDSLEVTSLTQRPELAGRVEATGVDLRRWLALWDEEAPALADPTALRSLDWKSELRIHPQGIRISGLEAMLDDTPVRGEGSLLDFERPRIAVDLHLGELDLDRYLPQADGPEADGASEPASGDGGDLPIDWLRRQRLAVKLEADRLRWQGLELSESRARLSAERGRWELESLSGWINDGTIDAAATLDVSGGIPTYRMDLELEQLEIGRVLGLLDEGGHTPIAGATDLDLALDARGRRLGTFWPSLTGHIDLTVRNGALQVGGVARAVESAVAALQERPSETTAQGRLPFDLLVASWSADDGRLTSRELKMNAGAISLDGLGYIDLPQSTVDYQLNVRSGDDLRIPVRIRGPFDDLSHSLDMSSLVEEQLGRALEKKLRSTVEEAEEEVEKPGEVLRKLLDDLF